MTTRPLYASGTCGGYGGDWKGGTDAYWAADDCELATLDVEWNDDYIIGFSAQTRSDTAPYGGCAAIGGFGGVIEIGFGPTPSTPESKLAPLEIGHYFVYIQGQINDGTPMLIRSFTIFDNLGYQWNFGNRRLESSVPFELQCPPGYEIAGFFGRTGNNLDALGIYMRLRKGATPGGGNAGGGGNTGRNTKG